MKYDFISADCHIDLIWLPPDLFTANAPAALKDRMPYVVEGRKGMQWVAKNGANFGLMNGMGSAGREYVPGEIHRSDRMASTGLYDDGRKGIRRLTDPELRLKDQERDGVQAEVLYGILGASMRLKDDEAATEMLRIYNEWLGRFLPHASRPLCRAGVDSEPRYRRGGGRGQARRQRRRRCAVLISPTGSIFRRSGIPAGTRYGTSPRKRSCRCICIRSAAGSRTSGSWNTKSAAPPSRQRSPAFRCICRCR